MILFVCMHAENHSPTYQSVSVRIDDCGDGSVVITYHRGLTVTGFENVSGLPVECVIILFRF